MAREGNTVRDRALAVQYRPIGSIKPDAANPRSHNPPQIAAIARSIKTFGFNVPLLVDAEGRLIAGHGRLAAAIKLQLSEVPTLTLGHLSELQRQAYMIADNRLTDLSRWDDQLLGAVLRDLSVAELDFELDTVGFNAGEIDFRIEGLGDAVSSDLIDEPVDIAEHTVSMVGDLWQLGPHRLLCSSALDAGAWDLLMDGAKADVGFTDPPYNLRVNGHVSGLGRVRHREFVMASGEMSRDEFTEFLEASFCMMAKHSRTASIHFAAIDWAHVPEMISAGEAAFTELKNICIWSKPSGGMGALYRSQYEMFFVWKSGRGRHQNNIELGRNGRNRTNIWDYPNIAAFRHSEGGDLLQTHPTCKPVSLVADAILDVSKRGDVVIDPFMGSGTTIMAAERIGRVAFGIELDPRYIDAAIRRFENQTGREVLHASGETFAAISTARLMGQSA